MKVLLVTASSGSHGGGEIFFTSLANSLNRKGLEVVFWASQHPQMDPLLGLLDDGVSVVRSEYTNTYHYRSRSLRHVFPNGKELRPLLAEWERAAPDVVHINKQCLEDGLDLLDAANTFGRPNCCTIHITQSAQSLGARNARLRDCVARRKLRNYKGLLMATARPRARELGDLLNLGKPSPMVLNGVEIPPLQKVEAVGAETLEALTGTRNRKEPVAVSVGRLEEQKDPLKFIELVVHWKRSSPSLRAYWIGDGNLRKDFEDKIRDHGAQDWIHCLGWQKDPFPYLCMADVYIHPARFEGLPFSLLEAMARGKPCVLLERLALDLEDIPVSTWILGDDPDRMVAVLNDAKELSHYSRLCRSLAEKMFSNEAMAEQYVSTYEELVASGSVGKGP